MPRQAIPFVGQAYEMPAIQLDAQTCINWYPTIDSSGKFPSALLPTPGMVLWADDDNNHEVRGLFQLNGVLYAVVDNSFRKYDANGNYEEKGTLKTSSGNVRMIANDFQVFITDTKYGYVYQVVATDDRDAGVFIQIEEATSFVGTAVFDGAGTDDMLSGGSYIGPDNKNYRVEIDSVGSDANPDTFRWSDSDGAAWNAETVQINGNSQDLNDGVTVQFFHTIGHTLHDQWTFATSVDSSFYVPLIPAYQDNYGIFIKKVSNVFYVSEINDFSKVNATAFAKTNALPDNLVAGISIREELWLLCKDSTEVWYNTGVGTIPFQRRTNLVMSYGCAAPYSVSSGDNNLLFWLGRNSDGGRVVIFAAGYQLKIVSTESINAEIDKYTRVDDAIGWVEQLDGHIFYHLIFPSADKSWTYDMKTDMWHERRSRATNELPASPEYRQGRWRANNYIYFNDKRLVGDFASGKIYQLSTKEPTENGTPISRERASRIIQNLLDRIVINSLQIDFQAGEGLTTGQGSDPQMMLQVSKDDGVSWGNELWRSAGKIGEYRKRVKWNRLGAARSFTFRIRTTDPIYNVIMGAVADIEDTLS
jgi:hypothetical protein